MSVMMKSISVVIPAFNEDKRIGATVQKIYDYLNENAETFEIVIVDDGSRDSTVDIIRNVSERIQNIKLLSNGSNKGKGFSVKNGILHSTCSIVLISDADLSTPIEEVEKFLPWIDNGYDIVIGSRRLEESEIMNEQPWYRQLMGKAFNALVKILVLGGFNDTQCGFKLLKSEPAKRVFNLSKIYGFAFDVEILFIANKMGYRIKEVPVRWINSPHSRVRIMRDPLKMFLDLFRIRFL